MKLYCARRGQVSGSAAVYALLGHGVRQIYNIPMPIVAKEPTGKPYFPDRQDIHFSLSHTSSHVLCAVSEALVGADIEAIRSVRPGVPERVCMPDELSMFDFFELWTLKESFIKVSGNTNVFLKNIVFSRTNGKIVTPDCALSARLFNCIPGCRAAVCSAGVTIPESIEMVDDLNF